MKYKYLLFDLDGTLFDYDSAERSAVEKTFRYSGLKYSQELLANYRKINKQIWSDYEAGDISQDDLKTERFRRLIHEIGVEADPEGISSAYLNHLSHERVIMPGALPLLRQLDASGFALFLITNGLKEVQRKRLSGSEITPLFSDIFISEEIGAAKPDIRIFKYVFKRMGDPPKSEVLIIGDSLSSDIAGGIAAGIDTCWFNPGNKKPDTGIFPSYVIRELSELTKILA